uniref:C-type lectin domain-containing protein n=1 Tax=Sinocyclocheilus anshuiensis TaxID=1608454 RepID=A0A671R6K5_9TELE
CSSISITFYMTKRGGVGVACSSPNLNKCKIDHKNINSNRWAEKCLFTLPKATTIVLNQCVCYTKSVILKEYKRWKCYQSSLFYLSSERTSWTESRRYCTERGEFVRKWSDKDRVWIGLTDSDVEGRWKWVDGSTLTSGFWMSAEPDGYRGENCALTVVGEWADHPCTEEFNWMCERSTV